MRNIKRANNFLRRLKSDLKKMGGTIVPLAPPIPVVHPCDIMWNKF